MGFPPPPSFPAKVPNGPISLGAEFASPAATIALPCGITIAIPSWVPGFSITISIPGSPPKFPPFDLNFHFKLSCNLSDPLDVSASLTWGGGREDNAPPDPDDSESDPTY